MLQTRDFGLAPSEVDRNLLNRCLGQEPGAWKDFVDRYLGLFIHVLQHTAHARSVALSADDVDDLCAEMFLAIVANNFAVLRRFRGQSSLATYLTVVARRLAVKEISQRRHAEALGHVRAQVPVDRLPAATPEPQTRLENTDLVQRMMIGLSAAEAEIVRQYHLDGKSYREISEALDVPENTIGPTLSRAREKLRKELAATLQ
jgi:RNA polymerase sigma-70 factor (ECF subfamily)